MLRKSAIALAFFAAASLAGAAQATKFSFTFDAPLGNLFTPDGAPGPIFLPLGDTARGSGTFTASDADGDGDFEISAVTGTFTGYDGGDAYSLTQFNAVFNGPTVLIRALSGGGYFVGNVGLATEDNDRYIEFVSRDDTGSAYVAGYGEVGAINATFSVERLADVPEPASWGLMLIGFGAMGAAMRRRPAALPA